MLSTSTLKVLAGCHGKHFKINFQNLFSLMSDNGMQLKLSHQIKRQMKETLAHFFRVSFNFKK